MDSVNGADGAARIARQGWQRQSSGGDGVDGAVRIVLQGSRRWNDDDEGAFMLATAPMVYRGCHGKDGDGAVRMAGAERDCGGAAAVGVDGDCGGINEEVVELRLVGDTLHCWARAT